MSSSVLATRKEVERSPSTPDEAYRNPQAERLLAELGIEWELQRLPLVQIDRAASLANQARFEPVHDTLVERYTTAMTTGAVFPPILVGIVNGKYIVADGNHRFLASEKAERETVTAYVFKTNRADFSTLANIANRRLNGQPNTDQEALAHAADAIEKGASPRDAAIQFGVTASSLGTYRKAEQSRHRFMAMGIPTASYAKLSDNAIAKIGSGITDEAVKLALDALNAGISPQRLAEAVSGTTKVQPYTTKVEVQVTAIKELLNGSSSAGKLKGRRRGTVGTRRMRLLGAVKVVNEALAENNLPANEQEALDELRRILA